MIEKMEDLGLEDLFEKYIKEIEENKDKEQDMKKLHQQAADNYIAGVDAILQEKLGLSLNTMKENLAQKLQEKARELTLNMRNIAPHADYSKLLEDNDSMANFLKSDAYEIKNWKLRGIRQGAEDSKFSHLFKFSFDNIAVDQGETLNGIIFINKNGKIKHSMIKIDE